MLTIIVFALCRRVAIIKSDKDTRYGLESIVTHNGEKFPCWPLSRLSSFKQRIGPDVYDKVFGVDSSKFYNLCGFCEYINIICFCTLIYIRGSNTIGSNFHARKSCIMFV